MTNEFQGQVNILPAIGVSRFNHMSIQSFSKHSKRLLRSRHRNYWRFRLGSNRK